MIFNISSDLNFKLQSALDSCAKDHIKHLCTGIIVYKDNKVLLVRRVPEDFLGGYYELAGGSVEPNETILMGLHRECLEELGVSITKIKDILNGFDFINRNGDSVRQINFYVDIEDQPIKLCPQEHDDIMWVTRQDYKTKKISKEMLASLDIFFKKY